MGTRCVAHSVLRTNIPFLPWMLAKFQMRASATSMSSFLPALRTLLRFSDAGAVSFGGRLIKNHRLDVRWGRQAVFPYRARGLTNIEFTTNRAKLGEKASPLVLQSNRILCSFATLPGGIDDRNEVRITGLKCASVPILDLAETFTTILFQIDVEINQSVSLRLR
jgi:hypothetical protein